MMKEKLSALRCELDRIREEMERLSSRIDAVCSEIDVLMEEDVKQDGQDDSDAGSEALDIEVDMPSFGNEEYADAAEAALPETSDHVPDSMVSAEHEAVDEPMLFSDLPSINDAASPARSIMDGYRDDYAWRTDRPGTPVNDLRSAITLNDRVLFINTLFGSDPVRFKDAVEVINTLDSLDSLLKYISSEGYDWDLTSETVYKFIMAARRKLG